MVTDTMTPLLSVEGLRVRIGEREVLRGIDLAIAAGETHVLLGPNGSGKTTLLNTILGMPGYEVVDGSMTFKGVDLLPLTIDERARLGIGIAFQRPPAVRGVKLRQVDGGGLRRPSSTRRASRQSPRSSSSGEMLDRDVNMGFSGGEAKRSEMGQLLAQQPDLALFDEPESGVDLDNIAVVGGAIQRLLKGAAGQRPEARRTHHHAHRPHPAVRERRRRPRALRGPHRVQRQPARPDRRHQPRGLRESVWSVRHANSRHGRPDPRRLGGDSRAPRRDPRARRGGHRQAGGARPGRRHLGVPDRLGAAAASTRSRRSRSRCARRRS